VQSLALMSGILSLCGDDVIDVVILGKNGVWLCVFHTRFFLAAGSSAGGSENGNSAGCAFSASHTALEVVRSPTAL
jgi:hypothetical protein